MVTFVRQLPYSHPYRWDGREFGYPRLWRPDNLGTSLAAWYDAEDNNSITLNATDVSQWNDKSGNGLHLVQATAANQPLYTNVGFLGKNVVKFNGTSDFLSRDTGFSGLTTASVFSVFKWVSGGATEDIVMGIGATNNLGGIRSFYRAPNQTVFGFSGWGADAISSFSCDIAGGFHIFGTLNTALTGTNQVKIMRDGLSSLHTPSGNLAQTVAGFTIGSLRGAGVGTYYSDVEVAETIVMNTNATQAQQEIIEGYLAWKWGLESNLPAGHPYKTFPPII
jgi:hypothetical protein